MKSSEQWASIFDYTVKAVLMFSFMLVLTILTIGRWLPSFDEALIEHGKPAYEYRLKQLQKEQEPLPKGLGWKSNNDSHLTEEDILSRVVENNNLQIPLKAVKVSFSSNFNYFHLTDLRGHAYITFDNLEDGKNYIGLVTPDKGELTKLISNTKFVFTYEDDWEDLSFLNDEIKEIQGSYLEAL